MTSDNVLLQIKNLKTGFHTGDGYVQAVRGVSFYVDRGERLGIVGESGCGKSVSMLSIMHLLEDNADLNVDEIMFDGEDLAKKSVKEMRKYQGNEISMIFQDPMTSLNPLFTIGEQICGPLRRHLKMSKAQARERALEVLNQVGIPAPEKRIHQYPHELSGGMRQRVMIAIAIACNRAGLRAQALDRGRAHNGPGRDDPGADSGTDAEDAKAVRYVPDLNYP